MIVGYRHYTVARVEKGSPIIIDPNRDRIPPPTSQLFGTTIVSAQSRDSDVKILQFALNPDKTLYVNIGGTYQLDRQLSDQILGGRCTNEFRATEALKSLREFASNHRVSALKYIGNEEQLSVFVRNHPTAARELLPTESEWRELSSADYRNILNWVRNCMGLFFPVFVVSFENPTSQEILITKVRYKADSVSVGKGIGEVGPLIPSAVYVHNLTNETDKEFDLIPPFSIPAHRNGSMELQLWVKNQIADHYYYSMRIEFVTNRGTVATDKFNLMIPVLIKK